MSKISIDLHDIFNKSKDLEKLLKSSFNEAVEIKAEYLEIIHGKGTGQLKKRVDRFLQLPENKSRYKRVKHDSKNFGRLFVYF
jgi:dsDNA-specific endonuclease/ATPase MutS2